MFKRATWTVVGYGMGIGSSLYVQRRVRRAMARYTPAHVRHDLARRGKDMSGRARALGADAAAALREGREVMRSNELDLRDQYLPRADPPRARRVPTR